MRPQVSRPALRIVALVVGLSLVGGTFSTVPAATAAPVATAAGQVHHGCWEHGLMWVMPSGNCGGFGVYTPWHQIGPTGPVGPRGPAGPKGAKGVRGQKGLKGKVGKPGRNGADGTDGADGQDGATGATGPRGPRGPMAELVTYSVWAETSTRDGRLMTVSASCDTGDVALGGGFETDGTILASLGQGLPSSTSWQSVALAQADELTELRVQVLCADLGPKHRKAG